MYQKHTTRGFVISSSDEGDDSKRLNIFTEDFGLISARVQGARTLRSKLRAGAQNFSSGKFSLVHGKAGWKVVSTAPDQNIFESLRHSKEKLRVITNVFNLLKKLAGEESVSDKLFLIVLNLLDFIVIAKDEEVKIAECLVLLRILQNLGYLRSDPDFSIPLSAVDFKFEDLESLIPKRSRMIELINESLQATQILT